MSQVFLPAYYQPSALAAAWLLAVYAVYLQALIVRRVRANDRDAGFGWWLGGAVCVGTGVWASTLLSLVSLKLPIQTGFVPDIILAAWLPAVVISGMTIWMLTHTRLSNRLRALGGVAIAVGVPMITFVDVSAMMLRPEVHWHGGWSLGGVAMLVAGAALGSVLLRRNLADEHVFHKLLTVAVAAGTVMALGQWMLVFAVQVPAGSFSLSTGQLSGDSIEFLLTATVLMLLVMGHLGTVQDEKSHHRQQRLAASLRQAQNALEEAAQQDNLTGLPNRNGFERALKRKMEGEGDAPADLSVIALTIDGFRAFVETYGHALGDDLVRHLAGRLRSVAREGDVLARADSDEFMLMCPAMGGEHPTAQLAQRLLELVREPCMINGHDLAVSASIGISHYPDSTNVEQLLRHATDAMLTARRAGGGVYCFHERGMDRGNAQQIELQRDLRHAIERNELSLYYQPKLRADNGRLAGVEALLRWRHPTRGMVSPVEFIPVAERFGLIGELGQWVLNEACRQVRAWHEEGLDIPIAVNVSPHQLRRADLEQRVREAVRRHRVPARMLIMEITESVAMDDIDASIRVFDMLDAIGVRLSIDDFGTGYSSLSYLRRLPARQLKIDRSFVKDLANSRDAQAIVEAVVRLAHALGLKVVAEGVETQDQADILAQLQCDELQGFLFGRPMPEHELLAWLVQRGWRPGVDTLRAAPSDTAPRGAAPAAFGEDDIVTAWSELEELTG